jgi:hypothetical protein
VLLAAFVAIELRSPAPLLPMQIFRNRMLSAANATAAVIGAIAFSRVLPADALHAAGAGLLRDRDGRRLRRRHVHDHRVLQRGADAGHAAGRALGAATGLTLDAVALTWFTQLPVSGHYFWDLFPAFLISGVGWRSRSCR